MSSARVGSLGSIIATLLAAWPAVLGLFPLNDNSFWTHLATGRLILESGSVPDQDPYTFTATGEPWVVQSWLASVLYAAVEQTSGALGLRVLTAMVFVTAFLLLWLLMGEVVSLVPRLVLAVAVLIVAGDVWSERPYMVGVIGLALVWLALDGRFPAWVLVPVLWIWGNAHGSWVLALVLAATVVVGRLLDEPAGREAPSVRRAVSVACWTAVGALAAAVGPLGLGLLRFPLAAVERGDVLAQVREWGPMSFRSTPERMFLVLVLVAVVALVRSRRWAHVLPALAFIAAALVAQRNAAMALVVLVPVVASLRPVVGTLRVDSRPSLGPALHALSCAVLVGAVVLAAQGLPDLGLGGYPTRPLALVGAPAPGALATPDFTGNLLEVLDGPRAAVFADDRYDMFPDEVAEAYFALSQGRPDWEAVLHDAGIEVVVWKRRGVTSSLLTASPRWRVAYVDSGWTVHCARGSTCGGSVSAG